MSIYGMSNSAIIKEIGNRIKQKRLNLNITQEELAKKSGLTRVTISETERGLKPFSILTLIQILRALNLLDSIDSFLPPTELSPLQIAKLKGKTKQRASKKHQQGHKKPSTW